MAASENWSLFGYDVRQIGHYFRAGWHDFLWEKNSPALAAVDETVRLHQPSAEDVFLRAGSKVSAPQNPDSVACNAVLLPDELALVKKLRVPLAAEPELASVIALEVSTGSPFAQGDTCFGWTTVGRDQEALDIALVISSRSAVMAHVAQRYGSHEVKAFEIWADIGSQDGTVNGGEIAVLTGFGEAARHARNVARMRRVAAMAGYCAIALLLIFAVSAGSKYLELQRVQTMHEDVQAQAADALSMREQLTSSKELIRAAQELTLTLPPPYAEFRRLTKALGDDTWLSSAEIKGGKVKIEGESGNAAAVMQQLLDDPAYASVDAPVAFKKVRSGMERFVFNLDRKTAVAPQ